MSSSEIAKGPRIQLTVIRQVGVELVFRKLDGSRSTRAGCFGCFLQFLFTGSFNLASFDTQAFLRWEIAASVVFVVVAGIVLYLCLRHPRQHGKRFAEPPEVAEPDLASGGEKPLIDRLVETRLALEVARAGAFEVDLTTGLVTWSDELHNIYGLNPGEFGGRLQDWLDCVLPEDRSRALADYQSSIACVSGSSSEFRIRRRDSGELRYLEARSQVLLDPNQRPQRMVGINADATERLSANEELRALAERFRHAQKMEAVGRLAGGVAHDFNNLLMVIRGYTEMVQGRLPPGDELHRYMQEVVNASARAAGLTSQLLAFSRKQILDPTVLDLNALVRDTTKMLNRLIGEDISVKVLAGEPLWPIRADADQIVQVLMNLCVNSRDAMPTGGTISVQTLNTTVGPCGLEDNAYVDPGEYVVLSVEDTGIGMSKQDMEHMFDPFFTTKPLGRGTGLGLSTVYGIVKQSQGYVWAESEPGKGTRFTIYFPRVEQTVASPLPITPEMAHLSGIETVLVVEDEATVRESICEFLRQRGYTVLSADSGEQALLISGRYAGMVDLLVSDLVLPQLGGRELSKILLELWPEMKVIYMSGHTDVPDLNIPGREYAAAFLQKPFSLSKLAQAMRDVLTKLKGNGPESRSA
jgi:two-component system, cell cycle sensor histidine kinase and response regulator CckA